MNERIAVTILCTAYNHERYIRDALEGFVMQKTSFPFEVLVHDDASTDKTADIIREYEGKYPDIIKPIYQTENQHSKKIPITRTFLLPRAQGKYIALCEGDDYWTDPMKLQKQYDFMEANPEYSMCACSTIWLDMRTGKTSQRCRTELEKDVSLEEIILETKGRVFQYATVFIKAEVYKSLPEWTRLFHLLDAPLAMHAALCGKVRMLPDTMAVYRNHAAGSWTARIDQNVECKTTALQYMIDGLQAMNEATDYVYNDVICLRIKRHKYNIARIKRDLKAMRSGELKEIYQSKPFPARISDVLYCKAPRLQALLLKLWKN